MAQSVHVGNSGNRQARTIFVGSSGNRRVTEGWIGTAGGNRQFFASLSASASGNAFAGPGQSQTNDVTVTPVNGASPYSYSWAHLSGDTGMTIFPNANAQTVSWTGPGGNAVATWRCTVTDSHGTVATVDVTVTFIPF